ncbi:hypothetical protein E5288_WYG007818 [Bos mutus]|uniref:Uncharacterized protein n=1 Tax=Bos mutus TaxID=72004 RepID=A0A6B0RM88_9CETA|nr:hypothetical protein [Bos mutus]
MISTQGPERGGSFLFRNADSDILCGLMNLEVQMVDGQQTCEPVRMTEALKVISLSDYNCDRLETIRATSHCSADVVGWELGKPLPRVAAVTFQHLRTERPLETVPSDPEAVSCGWRTWDWQLAPLSPWFHCPSGLSGEEGELPDPQPRSGVRKQQEDRLCGQESGGGLAVFPGVGDCRGPPCTRQCSVTPRNRSPLAGTAAAGPHPSAPLPADFRVDRKGAEDVANDIKEKGTDSAGSGFFVFQLETAVERIWASELFFIKLSPLCDYGELCVFIAVKAGRSPLDQNSFQLKGLFVHSDFENGDLQCQVEEEKAPRTEEKALLK